MLGLPLDTNTTHTIMKLLFCCFYFLWKLFPALEIKLFGKGFNPSQERAALVTGISFHFQCLSLFTGSVTAYS